MHRYLLIILFLFIATNIFSKDIAILYPTDNDNLYPGKEITIQLSNPMSLPVSIYYRLDDEEWQLIEQDYTKSELDWVVPQLTKSKNIYFKIEFYNIEAPQLYWHEEGVSLAEIRSGMFTPSGKYIVTSSADRNVKLWDMENRSFIKQVNLSSYGFVSYSVPYNDSIAIVAVSERIVIVNFNKSNPIERVIDISSEIRGVDCTELNGGMFAATSSKGIVYIYDLEGKLIREIQSIYEEVIYTVRFSRDAEYISFAGNNGYIENYEVSSGNLISTIKTPGDDNTLYAVIWSVDISPDNSMVLSGGTDRKARVWDINTGEELAQYESHTGHIRSVRFSNDSRLMITGALDGRLGLYDAMDLEEFKSILVEHGGGILSVDFSPDSKYIISSGRDNDFKVWRSFKVGEAVDSIQSSLVREFSLYIPHLIVNLNSEFELPIISNYDKSQIVFDKDEYDMDIAIEVPILLVDLLEFNTSALKTLDTFLIHTKFRPDVDTLTILDATTLLGPYQSGEIKILSIETADYLNINTEDGSVTILGDCPQDDNRNIELMGFSPIVQVNPNPASSILRVRMGVIEDGIYSLTINDLNSRVVMTKDLGFVNSGEYECNLDVSNMLNGTYNLIVSGKNSIFNTKIIIRK